MSHLLLAAAHFMSVLANSDLKSVEIEKSKTKIMQNGFQWKCVLLNFMLFFIQNT